MAWKEDVAQALDRLGVVSPGATQRLTVSAPGLQLDCELAELDRLACAFNRLSVSRDALSGVGVDRLRSVSEKLAARLTYLLEPIRPIEIDPEQCVVQLRSNPPQHDDAGTTYYELLARRDGELRLSRYRKRAGEVREAVPAHVTREVLLRLAADFAEAG